MLLLLMAATGGVMVSPELLNGSEVITVDDYPQVLLRSNRSAFENIRIVVAPSGKAETCDVIGEMRGEHDGTRNGAIGRLTCELMIRRARFRPAVGADGLPSYGTYSAWISWRVGDGLSYRQPDQVDGDISVASLPKGIPDPALVPVDVAVTADGTPGTCSASAKEEHAPPSQVVSPALTAVACAQFTGSGKLSPARSRSGTTVPSVQRLVARFSATKADPPAIPPPQ